MHSARPIRNVVLYVALVAIAGMFALPLIWMVAVSLTPPTELATVTFLPQHPQFDAYGDVLHSESFDFLLYARNTLILVVLSLFGTLACSSIAAYGFSRISFPGRDLLFGVCLATMMIPFPVVMVPQYMLFKQIGWIGTTLPLWVPASFGHAFNIFLLRQFFMGIPRDLEESAMIDGCSRWACFVKIILPLATPALTVVALFHTLAIWNDLVAPLIYLVHKEQFTLSLGLQFLQSRSGNTPWNQMMAAATLIVLPVLVLFVIAQRAFIRGIATTGLKE
ncbi:MAG: carbohydrate ABC transporter permease [Phycisphaerales bacterium]|nr:carbohydrate ABC transporter permease [Phycisphaerales bacterium]